MTDESLEAQTQRLIADHASEIKATELALRDLIRREFPGVAESVDFGNKLLAFGASMKMRDLMFAVIAHKQHVNLQLADGVDLPDPTRIVEGTGKRIRHVKVRSVEQAGSPAIRELVRAQVALRSK